MLVLTTQTDGSGYRLRISKSDMHMFQRNWKEVSVRLGDAPEYIQVRLTDSFWNKCSELRDKHISKWIIAQGLHHWRERHPNKLNLKSVGDRKFIITR